MQDLLTRLKELMSKATPGPWADLFLDGITFDDDREPDYGNPSNNIELIVKAINSLPELIKRAEAGKHLRAVLGEAEDILLLREQEMLEKGDTPGHTSRILKRCDEALAAYDAMVGDSESKV